MKNKSSRMDCVTADCLAQIDLPILTQASIQLVFNPFTDTTLHQNMLFILPFHTSACFPLSYVLPYKAVQWSNKVFQLNILL